MKFPSMLLGLCALCAVALAAELVIRQVSK